MPDFEVKEMDLSRVPINIHERYVQMIHHNHRSYYMLLLILSSGTFLFTAMI